MTVAHTYSAEDQSPRHKDQSLVQQLVDVGQISEAEAETHMFRNVILQALGAQSDVTPVTGRIRLRRGDTLLLCSDGLSGKLRAEDIQNIVVSNPQLAQACSELIAEANNRGGEDNITVVLARFDGDDLEEPEQRRITIEYPSWKKTRPSTRATKPILKRIPNLNPMIANHLVSNNKKGGLRTALSAA